MLEFKLIQWYIFTMLIDQKALGWKDFWGK